MLMIHLRWLMIKITIPLDSGNSGPETGGSLKCRSQKLHKDYNSTLDCLIYQGVFDSSFFGLSYVLAEILHNISLLQSVAYDFSWNVHYSFDTMSFIKKF